MRLRVLLFAAASSAALIATAAQAQTAAPAAPDESAVDEVVVTGTRTVGRSRLDTLAPVDVVTSKTLQERGSTELATALSVAVPSITFPRPANTDGTDAIRPAVLRGMGPDQTLVLVNGVRRHTTALINTNGSVGRGSAAVDLNAIPSTAIETIEVLRDGAAAQYGSDAIAGVINLRLRQADHGGGLTVTVGEYLTNFKGFYGRDDNISDGRTVTVGGWQGLKLGKDGFLTLSAEYRDRNNTNRSDLDPRVTPSRITSRFGDGDVEDYAFYANAAKPLGDTWEAYGFAGYQHRDATTAATYRLATDAAQNIPSVYPDGYLPLITTESKDLSLTGGLRGEVGGFKLDGSLSYGRNEIDFGVQNTLNPSLGPTSPHSFYAGGATYDQIVFSLDASREFDIGLAGPLNVAFGTQLRRETYQINRGEPGSYSRGAFTQYSFGSRGFTGFTPSNEVDVDRRSIGFYVDVEGKITDKFTVGAAARYEDYSDFGRNTSGKLSARYDFTPSFAIRGAVSTGFRAPSLQQQYFTSTSILYINGIPLETGTYPSVSAVGTALGGKPLKAETSKNYSLGLVWRAGAFELTADAYRIDVEDRIVLSETLTGSAAADASPNAKAIFALLAPYGASAARFFINGVDTKTEGLDVVARYRIDTDNLGTFDLTAAGNLNRLSVEKTPVTEASILPTPTSLFARQATIRFEKGTPREKLTLQTDWRKDGFGATVRSTLYGDVVSPGTLADGSADTHTSASALFDLEARYRFPIGITWSVGADNIFDKYPKQIPMNLDLTGAAPFSSFSPWGFNGRFVYTRLSYNW